MVPATSMAFIRLQDGVILGVAEPAADKPLAIVTSPRVPAADPVPVVSLLCSTAPAGAAAADPEVPEAAAVPPGTANSSRGSSSGAYATADGPVIP